MPYDSPAERAFMELVRCGLSDSAAPDTALFAGLDPAAWSDIYSMARRQTVRGICYSAICRLPGALLPPDALLSRWVARADAIETANRQMSAAVVRLVAAMRSAGLSPVVQKGLSVSRFYPCAELRECGDIDLWLPGGEFRRAVTLARSIGSRIRRNPDRSVSFIYGGFVVELHKRLVNIASPAAVRRLDALFGRMCRLDSAAGAPIPSPAPVPELLLIAVHIMRHAFGTGVGLRQICDYYCACCALSGSYSPDEFAAICRSLGISRWIAMLNGLLSGLLHAPDAILPPSGLTGPSRPVSAAALLSIIKEGGNFGHHLRGQSREAAVKSTHGKLHTVAMFLRRSRFAASVAPAEAFWAFVRLAFGQIHC